MEIKKEIRLVFAGLVLFGILLVVASVIFSYVYATRETAYRNGKIAGYLEGYMKSQNEVAAAIKGNGVVILMEPDGTKKRFISVWWSDDEIRKAEKERRDGRRKKK